MGSTALVAKGRAGVVAEENDEKANCLNNLKCRQKKANILSWSLQSFTLEGDVMLNSLMFATCFRKSVKKLLESCRN